MASNVLGHDQKLERRTKISDLRVHHRGLRTPPLSTYGRRTSSFEMDLALQRRAGLVEPSRAAVNSGTFSVYAWGKQADRSGRLRQREPRPGRHTCPTHQKNGGADTGLLSGAAQVNGLAWFDIGDAVPQAAVGDFAAEVPQG